MSVSSQTTASLVKSWLSQQEDIQGVSDPTSSETHEMLLQEVARIGQVRGRPLYFPFVASGRGRGPLVELIDGSVKMDLIGGIGVHLLGHAHPQLIKAGVEGALSDVAMVGHLKPNEDYSKLSHLIQNLASKNSRLKHVWLSTCGAMANENALKLARQKNSPRRKILAFESAFAGRSTLMAEITDNPLYKQGLPVYDEVLRLPFCDRNGSCLDSCIKESIYSKLRQHLAEHSNDIAAFVFEPILGEGGYKVPCESFFVPILKELRDHNVCIWADEIQTFGRTGELFAFETFGVGEFIDVCTVAKPLLVGATLYTSEYNPKPGLLSSTYSGTPGALRAGLVTLQEITENGYLGQNGRIARIHEEFMEMLTDLGQSSCKGLLGKPEGKGLMVAVTPMGGDKAKVSRLLQVLYHNHLMAFGCGQNPYRIRFLLPAILTSDDIATARGIIEKSILSLSKE